MAAQENGKLSIESEQKTYMNLPSVQTAMVCFSQGPTNDGNCIDTFTPMSIKFSGFSVSFQGFSCRVSENSKLDTCRADCADPYKFLFFKMFIKIFKMN